MTLAEFSYNNAVSHLDKGITSKIKSVLSEWTFNFEERNSRHFRNQLKSKLSLCGWSDKVVIGEKSNISITSFNQQHGLCVQTGNMGRFYADILKLEYLYKKERIIGAYYVIPTKETAKLIGSNIANFERFTKELSIFKEIVSIPILVYGFQK